MDRPAPAGLVSPAASQSSELLQIAEEAARAAGALLLERFEGGGERATGTKSTPTDLVSEADLAAERAIRELIEERRPEDAILGEEGGETKVGAAHRWIVDPLDGTVNFLFGLPQWCVSVAVHDDEGGVAGVVFDPLRGELFAGERGARATLDGEPVSRSTCSDLSAAMVATGFSYDAEVRERQAEVLTRLLAHVRDVRRMGSAALDLAYTAAGRYDVYYERALNQWDTAAGALLCECSGLEVRTLDARDALPEGLMVAPPGMIAALGEFVG